MSTCSTMVCSDTPASTINPLTTTGKGAAAGAQLREQRAGARHRAASGEDPARLQQEQVNTLPPPH